MPRDSRSKGFNASVPEVPQHVHSTRCTISPVWEYAISCFISERQASVTQDVWTSAARSLLHAQNASMHRPRKFLIMFTVPAARFWLFRVLFRSRVFAGARRLRYDFFILNRNAPMPRSRKSFIMFTVITARFRPVRALRIFVRTSDFFILIKSRRFHASVPEVPHHVHSARCVISLRVDSGCMWADRAPVPMLGKFVQTV